MNYEQMQDESLNAVSGIIYGFIIGIAIWVAVIIGILYVTTWATLPPILG